MKKQLIAFLLFLLGGVGISFAQTGLDPSFGKEGTNMGWGNIGEVTLTGSKAYFLGGHAKELPKHYLAFALRDNGSFDSSFGTNGYVYKDNISLLLDFSPNLMGVISNGILLLDKLSDRTSQVVRFDSLGNLDYSYGQNGKAFLAALSFPIINTDAQDRLLYAGQCYGCGGGNMMSLLRYKSNGMPDSSFGIHGKVNTRATDQYKVDVYSVETGADGKVVVGEEGWNELWAAYRYHPDGRVDSSFGGDGHTTIHWSGKSLSKALVRPNGKVVMCGYGDSVTVVQLYCGRDKTVRPDLSKRASIPLSTLQAWNLKFDFLSLAQYKCRWNYG